MRRILAGFITFVLIFLSVQSVHASYTNSSDGPIFSVNEPITGKTNALFSWQLTYDFYRIYQLSGYDISVNNISLPTLKGSFEGVVTNAEYSVPYLLPGYEYEVKITPFTSSKVWSLPAEKSTIRTLNHTGWIKVVFNGAIGQKKQEWLYINPNNGGDKKGWLFDKGKWYYLQGKYSVLENKYIGVMVTGWKKVNGKWYYLNPSGDMKTGWVLYSNKWYYLNKNGDMRTGWLNYNNNWFYLNSDGDMEESGWKLLSGKWYYFYNNGKMAYNTYIQGYKIGKDGAWIK